MEDGMDEHRKTMRERQQKDMSNRRIRCLKEMQLILEADKDVPPKEIEAEVLLAIGRSEGTFQYRIAEAKLADWKRAFNKQPWWKRVWQGWKKIPVGLIPDSCESILK